jgi:hypothetical protein
MKSEFGRRNTSMVLLGKLYVTTPILLVGSADPSTISIPGAPLPVPGLGWSFGWTATGSELLTR